MPSTERWLDGRHAVVTGASRGIGAGVASMLASRGAALTIMARSADALNDQAAALRKTHGIPVGGIVCDVASEASVRAAFDQAVAERGRIDVLVNNAGIARSKPFLETTRAIWDETLAVNLTGIYLCTQQVLPGMLAEKFGRIVNMASTSGLRGYKTMSAYCAAKHGVIGLTRSLALETAAHGVTVNAVCPGYVETDIFEQAMQNLMTARGIGREEARQMLVRPIPTGRFTTVEEVASAIDWLCSPGGANVTGIAVPLTGGEVQ